MRMALKFLLALLVLLALGFIVVESRVSLKGTGSPPDTTWQLTDVSGHLPDLRFSLISDSGQPVTEVNEHGRVTLLFFGFTTCPDECPATMMRLASVLRQLGDDADHVHVLFTTVDPTRDTPSVLHDYLKNFDAVHMTGLTGSSDALKNLAKRYRAAYRPREDSSHAEDITHADGVYIFDKQGHARLLMIPADTDAHLAHDVRQLARIPATP